MRYSVLFFISFLEACCLGVDLSFFETHSSCTLLVRSPLTCSTGATFTSQTTSADKLLQLKPLGTGIKRSTRCSEEVMCSADYPVTAEDGYRTRLKPWERDDAARVCWDPQHEWAAPPGLQKEEGRIRICNIEKSSFLTFLVTDWLLEYIKRTSLNKQNFYFFYLFIFLHSMS